MPKESTTSHKYSSEIDSLLQTTGYSFSGSKLENGQLIYANSISARPNNKGRIRGCIVYHAGITAVAQELQNSVSRFRVDRGT